MMNVAAPPSTPLPHHFAPPARTRTARKTAGAHHQPTLHMRTGSSPRHSAHEFVNPAPQIQQPPPQLHYSPSQSSQQPSFQRSPSNRIITPQQQQAYPSHPQQQQRLPLQRQPTTGSQNSLVQYVQPAQPMLGHRRQTASTSTSNSSINRMPSGGHSQYPPSTTPPIVQVRPSPSAAQMVDTYVARLRRARATVWSARGQREDLDRSNSNKDDKYNKKYYKRPGTMSKSTKLVAGGSYSYDSGQYLQPHPRQLQPRLSANEVEDTDEDPFISGPNFFDTQTAVSTKESTKTKSTGTSPTTSAKNVNFTLDMTSPAKDDKSSLSVDDGRGSPDPMQSYFNPPRRGESKRISRVDDDVNDRQVGGGRRLFVVNASPSESEDEA